MRTITIDLLRRVAHLTLNQEPMDVWLSKWGSIAGGLILVAWTFASLHSQAATRAELWLGVGVALVVCLNLFLFGVLSRQVHLAWHKDSAPRRIRIGELLGIATAIGIAGAGFWCIMTLHLTAPGMIVGGLVVLSIAIATMCLGLWSTLAKTAEPSDARETSAASVLKSISIPPAP